MEMKTIGSFIATLRKANGMTQRDLAERLNVSDKTVSRWEQDNGAPDLSLIPVIAELFGVTCDELLRGERKPAQERADETADSPQMTAKAEKAMKRILREAMTSYRTRSMIAIAVAVCGLIAALVANTFFRAQLGFCLCCAFQLAAAVCQGVFLNRALFAISADELPQEEVFAARRNLVDMASRVFCTVAMLLMATLPMLLVVPNSYYGINGEGWFVLAVLGAAIAWGLWCFVNDEVIARLTQRGFLHMDEKHAAAFYHNNHLKWRVTKVLAIVLTVTGLTHGFMANAMSAYDLAEPLVFNDYESFKTYMETDTRGVTGAYSLAPNNEPVELIDNFKSQLTLKDGTVVLEFYELNESAIGYSYTEHDGSLLPISVHTQTALQDAETWVKVRNVAFCFLYAAELLAAIIVYRVKRAK